MNLFTRLSRLTWRFYLSCFSIAILILTIHIAYPNYVSAQSLSSLDAEIRTLKFQVQRLEAEVRSLRRSSSPASEPPSQTFPLPAVVDGEIIGRSDPRFERLATLAIELKEDVRALQGDIRAIQKKLGELEDTRVSREDKSAIAVIRPY